MSSEKFKIIRLVDGKDLPVALFFTQNSKLVSLVKKIVQEGKIEENTIIVGEHSPLALLALKLFSKTFLKNSVLNIKYLTPLAIVVFDRRLLHKIKSSNTMINGILEYLSRGRKIHYYVVRDVRITLADIVARIPLFLKAIEYRPLKFAIVGSTGILVNEGLLWLLVHFFAAPIYVASPIAIELSIINNFILNDIWTFKRFRTGSLYMRLAKYHFAVAVGALVNYIILLLLTFLGIFYLLANLVGIFLGYLANYLLSELLVWARHK
ncbi:MAG: hypothetical protein DRO23_07705 [Thermoprotei archaeon]|nr:MAG: hypothetical protein DRO23_07705 [Thermoprotei archaeon]